MCLLRGWLCARLSWGVLLLGESRFSGVPLLNEAYVPIVDGIQLAGPRHVGGAAGGAARLPVGQALLLAHAIASGLVRTANPYRWYCDVCERG